MRKLLLALLMLLPSIGISAQGVSEEQARQTAANFIASKTHIGSLRKAPMQTSSLQLAWAPKFKGDNPEIYVFNFPGNEGFVIVSGDEATSRQVLGWSDKGSFDPDNLAPALRYISAKYVADIASMRQDASYYNAPKILRAPSSGYGEVKPLLKTQWNQEEGYNDLLPEYPTGCVATAIAQIMNYHQWPKHGYGKHTNAFLAKKGIDQTVDFSESAYDWEGMKNGESAAISKLMYDIGCAVNMQYTNYESGANDFDAMLALVTNFGYDEGTITYGGRSDTSLRNELRNGRPVFYVGQDTITKIVWIDSNHYYKKAVSESHAMVCDGFSDDGLFHFNIGWGGKGDGYYSLDVIRPNGDGDLTHSYGPLGYMITGIKPGEKTCIDGTWYALDESTGTATFGSGGYEGDVTVHDKFTYEGKTYTVSAIYPYALTERRDDEYVIKHLTFNANIDEFPARFIRRGETVTGCVENVSFGGGVRRIAENAFLDMKDLKSVTLGDNVESIGAHAFMNCTSLQDLTLSKSLKEISDYAFSGCKISDLDIPENIKRIGKYGVSGIFNSVKIHGPLELDTCAIGAYDQIYSLEGLEHCTRIAYKGIYGATGTFTPNPNATYDRYALSGKFDKIIIPADCKEYDYTTALETKEFYVHPDNPNYASAGGAFYTKDMKTLLAVPIVQHDGTYNGYDRYVPMGVTEITEQPVDHAYMFLYLPPSLKHIRGGAIGRYNISRVYCMSTTPPEFDEDSQGEIQYNAELHVPANSEQAYANAPVWSKFNSIIGDMYSDGMYTYIYDKQGNFASVIGRNADAFSGHDFTVPSMVEIDGEKLRVVDVYPSVFQGDYAVESVTLGAFIEYINNGAFKNCSNLKRIKLDGDIYDIYDNAFANCSALEKVEIPRNNHLIGIGERAFYGCSSLNSLDLTSQADYFWSFGKSAFEGCTSLRSVKGISNLHTLPGRTFANSGIESFHVGPEMYSFENIFSYDSENPFDGCDRLHTFTVSPDNNYSYEADGILYYYHEWDKYPWSLCVCPPLVSKDGNVAERTVVNISERCDILSTKFPSTVKEVIIPASVQSIQYGVFNKAEGMEKVTVLRNDPNFVSGDLFHDAIYGKATLQVPKGTKEAYAAHYEWKRFANIVEVDPDDYPSPEAIKAKQEAEQNAPDDPTVGNALEILMQDGSTHFIRLAQLPVITIGDGQELNITGSNINLSLPIVEIKYYRFGTYDLSLIDTVTDDSHISLDFTDGNLNAAGLKDGEHVMLYDLQGRLVMQTTAGSDGTISMALSGLPTAVYLLKVNGTTYKILKK